LRLFFGAHPRVSFTPLPCPLVSEPHHSPIPAGCPGVIPQTPPSQPRRHSHATTPPFQPRPCREHQPRRIIHSVYGQPRPG
jgi:hypothetical protein